MAGVAYQSSTEPFDTATPAGKLFLGILAVIAEFESDSITQRTADGRARVAQIDHRWIGGPPPFGYTSGEDKVLVVNPEEAAAVRELFSLSVNDDLGAQRIADTLNARGITYTSTGPRAEKPHFKRPAPWHAVAVNDILRNPLYAGRASYFKKSTQGRQIVFRGSPPIVTQALFAAAQAAVARRATWGGSHAKYDYPLRGLLTCARDGRNLIGRKWYGRGDGRGVNNRPIYCCEHCPAGERPIIDERQVLDILWSDVLEFLEHAALRAMARTTGPSPVRTRTPPRSRCSRSRRRSASSRRRRSAWSTSRSRSSSPRASCRRRPTRSARSAIVPNSASWPPGARAPRRCVPGPRALGSSGSSLGCGSRPRRSARTMRAAR